MTERPEAPAGYSWHDLDGFEPRRLEVLVGGPDTGYPLLYHSGTPTGAAPFPLLVDAAGERGFRTITYSRPGYGTSSTALGRQVALGASDAAHIVKTLGYDEFVTIGWSGGGPHALACAALVNHCLAAGIIAGVAPRDAEGLDWSTGMAQENLEEFDLAALGGEEFDAFLEAVASAVPLLTNTEEIAAALGDLVTERDVETLASPGLGEYMMASLKQAVLRGTTGWRDDDVAMLSPWGADVSAITKPVLIWHGTDDHMVPLSHGEWLDNHLPNSSLHRGEGEGHISIVPEAVPDIVDFLGKAAGI